MERWHIYIVECSDGSLYTGIAKNVRKRIQQHNSGKGAKYTRSRRPVVLKAIWLGPSQHEALKEEYLIKKLSRKEKLVLLQPDILPREAYYHACVEGRVPESEDVLANDPYWACIYAYDILTHRFIEAESIVAHSSYKRGYLEHFPEAKEDWVLNGWLDWLDT